MSILAAVGAVLGLVGTVLGIVNAARAALATRVRLSVRAHPRILLQQGVGQIGRKISFRVVNLSSFPVVIDAVGFILKRGGRFLVIDPIVGSGQRFPGRLESRDAMTLLVDDTPERRHQLREAIRPFVTTACGVERLGPRTDADCLSGRESLPYE